MGRRPCPCPFRPIRCSSPPVRATHRAMSCAYLCFVIDGDGVGMSVSQLMAGLNCPSFSDEAPSISTYYYIHTHTPESLHIQTHQVVEVGGPLQHPAANLHHRRHGQQQRQHPC